MYADFLLHQAVRRPDAVAVSMRPLEVTYATLDAHINRVAHGLQAFDLPQRGVVAVDARGSPYWHWLVTLALARLDLVSSSFFRRETLDLLAPDAVLSALPYDVPDGMRCHELDEPWWQRNLKTGDPTRVATTVRPSDAARLVVSSGTTGVPKKVLLSHEIIIRRIGSMLFGAILRGEERAHVALGVDTVGGFQGVLRTWWVGGAAVLGPVGAKRLVADHVTGLLMSPSRLRDLVDELPAGFSPPALLQVRLTGSAIPQTLSTKARMRLGSDLTIVYGSTETSSVASCPVSMLDADEHLAGVLLPWVEVEAVGPSGAVLPAGEVGEIRIRSADMVHFYLDDGEATRTAFRDGWFYPGDLGSVSDTRLLRIAGRVDEVLNLGGSKMTPNIIEHAVSSCPGVSDVAAFSMPAADGLQQVWVAVVPDAGLDPSAIETACRGLGIGNATILRLRRIPRNAMGKIDRPKLREAAATARDAGPPAEALQ